MGRIKYYLNAAKEYGFINCVKRVVGTCIYCVVSPVYKFYLMNFTKIDDNKIVFCSKPSFSDNSKALYDYLKNLNQDDWYQFVWMIGYKEEIPQIKENNTIFIRRHVMSHGGMTLAALKETATAKYVFFTHGSPLGDFGKTRKEQMVINLWHGCGYKDIQKSSTSWISKNPCDYSLVPGNVFVKTKAGFWGCEEEKILPIGYPRYDSLYLGAAEAANYAEQLRGNAEKLIVWMPTFRKTKGGKFPESKIKGYFELPLLDGEKQLDELNRECKTLNTVICVKRHPSQLVYECEKNDYSNIKFINNEDLKAQNVDLYAFLKYTDALISDYSSIAIDYLLLHKPIAFSLDDYNEYKKTRGFVFENPLDYMPGHHLYEFSHMKQFLQDVAQGKDLYAKERADIMDDVHNRCSNYCERIWKTVKKLLK